jgi:hypothetical protein
MGAVFLLDSSHPQQFKVEWMDEAFDPVDVAMTHDEKEHAIKQLTIMLKALNFNFDEVRWERLRADEKFKVFEDLSFQARTCAMRVVPLRLLRLLRAARRLLVSTTAPKS